MIWLSAGTSMDDSRKDDPSQRYRMPSEVDRACAPARKRRGWARTKRDKHAVGIGAAGTALMPGTVP